MLLKHVKLENYRQHRTREEDFDGSLIAILGKNGAGKSNFLGALQFALTGEQPGANKKDLVSWGEKDGFVQLDFEHGGTPCSLKRFIASPACSLTIGEERINGAKAVEAALKERFNVDKDLFKQVVFVRQAEVDAILFDEPRKRELAFQRLAGLGDTEKMYNVLGGIITKYDKPNNYETWLDDAERNLAETRAKADEMSKHVEKLEKDLVELPPKEDMLSNLAQIQSEIGTEKQRKDLRTQLENEISVLDNARSKLDEIVKAEPDGGPIDGLRAAYGVVENAISLRKKLDLMEFRVNSATTAMTDATASEAPTMQEIEAAEKEYSTNKDRAAALSHRVLTLEDYLRVVNGSGNCPVCGSTLAFDLDKKLRDELAEVQSERAEVVAKITNSEHENMRKRFEAKELAVKVASERLASAEEMLKSAKQEFNAVADSDQDLEGLEKKHSTLRAALDAKTLWEKSVNDARTTVSALEKTVERLKAAIPPEGDVVDVSELSNQAALISDGIRKHDETATMLATLRGSVNASLEQISASEKYIAELREKKAESDRLKERVDTLSTVRRALHYTAIPRTLSQKIVNRLTDGVNGYLDLFSAPFTVEPAPEGVGFVCRFTDGRKMPDELPDATFLSGGQKVQLAVAFRFATYELFAPKLGLLVLDEPTAYLDDSAIGRFGDVLKKVMEAARSMNVQILCATHHQQVSAQADKVIEF